MSDVLEQIRRSLRKYGAIYPVLVDHEGRLIDGAHRLKVWKNWPKVPMKVNSLYDLYAIRTIANTARRDISTEERRQEIRKMGDLLEKMGIKSKRKQAQKIAQDTGLSENYVRWLLEEPRVDYDHTPPEAGKGEGVPPKPMREAIKEAGRRGGKLGGRPVVWLLVCPSCGFKGKRSQFGKVRAEDAESP